MQMATQHNGSRGCGFVFRIFIGSDLDRRLSGKDVGSFSRGALALALALALPSFDGFIICSCFRLTNWLP